MELISGGEGNRFTEIMNEFSHQIRELGPIGLGEGMSEGALTGKLEAVTSVIPYVRLVERERLRVPLNNEEEFAEYFESSEFKRLFCELIADQLAVSQILLSLKEKPLSTGEIAKNLGLTPSEVAKHMNNSSRHGLVRYDVGRKCYALS
jgi:biotin operon repressor